MPVKVIDLKNISNEELRALHIKYVKKNPTGAAREMIRKEIRRRACLN